MPTSKPSILILEDEIGIVESLRFMLEQEFMLCLHAASLAEARALLNTEKPDCLVLDIGLPDGSGLDLLRSLRSQDNPIPVIVLTSRDAEVDRVVGLELGADDYVTKPFSARELVARIKAVLRRLGWAPHGEQPTDDLHVDLQKRQASVRGQALALTRTELDLLAVLEAQRGRVFERSALLDRVWSDDVSVGDRTVDVHINSLRRKLQVAGAAEDLIETVRGVGYRMRE